MRLTFTRDNDFQHTVSVNGEAFLIDSVPETVPETVSAVQVYTTYTEVENLDMTNDVFADAPNYVHELVQAWQSAKDAYIAEQEELLAKLNDGDNI